MCGQEKRRTDGRTDMATADEHIFVVFRFNSKVDIAL
jgi:hypothetical protein